MQKTMPAWRLFTVNIKHLLEYLFISPLKWLFLCFFQPLRFSEQFEYRSVTSRFKLVIERAIPLFLLIFLVALPIQVLLICTHSCTLTSIVSWNTLRLIFLASLFGVTCGLIVAVIDNIGLGIILSIALGVTGIVIGDASMAAVKGIAVAIALGLVAGTARGMKWGWLNGAFAAIFAGLFWAIASISTFSIPSNITSGITVSFVFFVSYTLGYYRIPLYLASGPSGLWAYVTSKKNPAAVFTCLHHSSLYWDECVFLPLPLLHHTLLIAVGQDRQQALKEIAFIVDQRPQQKEAALVTAIEVALRDMRRRETIRDIARASQSLNEILPQSVMLNDPGSLTPFTYLREISLEAERYTGPLGWQTRRDALETMLLTLEKIYPNSAFPDPQLNTLLADVIAKWHAAIGYQQEKLEQGAESMGQVLNPYNPGNPLKPQDTLFVGRRDVVRQLSESLSKTNRSTFLLNGERRMGKSSTLRQLPHLLGASYIPVLYDLQIRSISSSIDAFLTRIAEELYKAVRLRGINIERLDYSRLREALQRNEAAIYQPFDAWLDSVESRLQRENRTVFLLFDEFEKLEEANKAAYLDLNLLLDWFRITMQNRSHIALLFSGVNTFGEIGENWAGYFVNAKTFRISFLRPEEARELITRPVPNFPSSQLFAEGVVEEIIHLTGCHPFLVQAVCSELIDNLNKDNRSRVEVQDVANATRDVLENWWDTYFRDLWARTDQQQRTCLSLLCQRGASDASILAQHSDLEEATIRQTLQVLLKRDLVLQDQHTYCIAAPIFHQWIERNS